MKYIINNKGKLVKKFSSSIRKSLSYQNIARRALAADIKYDTIIDISHLLNSSNNEI